MPTLGWRWLVALSSLPLLLLLLFYPLLPESPRFLLVKGKSVQALAILRRVAAANGKMLPEGTLSLLSSEEQPDRISSSPFPSKVADSEPLLVISSSAANDGDGGMPTEGPGDPLVSPSSRSTGTRCDNTSSSSGSSSSSSSWFPTLSRLLQPPYRSSTLLLWGVFFANAFTYYGLVLLTTQLAGDASAAFISSCSHMPAPDGGASTAAAAPAPAPAAAAAAAVAASASKDGLYSDVFVTSAAGMAVRACVVVQLAVRQVVWHDAKRVE